jgi:hypothetical protein
MGRTMSALLLKTFLAVAGVIAVGLILLAPVAFYAGYGLDLVGQVTLLNELRSHGFSLIGIGLLIAAGALVQRLTTTSLLVAAFFYLTYGFSRLLGIVLDGAPADGLVASMAVELAMGALSALIYISNRNRRPLVTA